MDPLFLAMSRLRRRKFDEAVLICNDLLQRNTLDQAAWALKAVTLAEKTYIDDTEVEDDGVAEVMFDDHAIAQVPTTAAGAAVPGTAGAPRTASGRPLSSAGRPLTGFARPGTNSRPMTGSGSGRIETAFQGARPGTSRPMTALGRIVRLGTASMAGATGEIGATLDVERMDVRKYAKDPALSKILCNYLLYHDGNARKALDLAAEATAAAEYRDWWWKVRVGQCYYRLGLVREAEKQFRSALRDSDSIVAALHVARVCVRLDQPAAALEVLQQASLKHSGDTHLLLAQARIHEATGALDKAEEVHRRVLALDPANVEALASLAAHCFYADQPEVALRYYRRLLQMGVSSPELWSNLGLCCFYASQYDMTLSCFERALALANDDTHADVWYNIGQVAIGVGDVVLAYQAFKLAVSADANHAEAFVNLGVLELRQGNTERARAHFATAQNVAPLLHEGWYNGALLAFKAGDFQEAYRLGSRALQIRPDHADSAELMQQLKSMFAQM